MWDTIHSTLTIILNNSDPSNSSNTPFVRYKMTPTSHRTYDAMSHTAFSEP